MDIINLHKNNEIAVSKSYEFRKFKSQSSFGDIDDDFHYHKNHFPYFGYIEVNVEGNGFVMFSSNDDLIAMTYFWYGASSYEIKSLQIWLDMVKDSENVFDVGAFSGVYSLAAAASNRRCNIFAFEPSRRTYGRLLVNIQSNNFVNRIVPVNLAISDNIGETKFLQYRGENILGNGASLMDKGIQITSDDEIVKTVTMDSYISEHPENSPEAMKIDVEGAEVLLLHGMGDLLTDKSSRPRIIIEVTPETSKSVYDILKGYGYSIWGVDDQESKLYKFDGNAKKVMNLLVE